MGPGIVVITTVLVVVVVVVILMAPSSSWWEGGFLFSLQDLSLEGGGPTSNKVITINGKGNIDEVERNDDSGRRIVLLWAGVII
jgi:hypothetical protein